jgi:hypothetical protein
LLNYVHLQKAVSHILAAEFSGTQSKNPSHICTTNTEELAIASLRAGVND